MVMLFKIGTRRRPPAAAAAVTIIAEGVNFQCTSGSHFAQVLAGQHI